LIAKATLEKTEEGRPVSARLNSATGPQFDREFLQETSADHDKLIRDLKQEREDATKKE
jgi:hypothetical protein